MAQMLPSISGADILRLKDGIELLERENMAILYADMMDGNFVSNTTFGPNQIGIMEKVSRMIFDVYMITDHPKGHLDDVITTGAEMISVHYESTPHIHNMIRRIKKAGRKAGVILNPGTPESVLEYLLNDIDYVLTTIINLGMPGQTFIEKSLEKIANLKEVIGSRPIRVEVGGGVNDAIAKQVAGAGVRLIVIGGYSFGDSLDRRYNILRGAVR